MITWVTKNWKLVLEAALIVVALVVFAAWDPFKMLHSEPTLADTPLSIKSIKNIGTLTTAEYYGEVVASLKESKIREFTPEELTVEAIYLSDSLMVFFHSLKQRKKYSKRGQPLRRKLSETTLQNSPFWEPYMRFMAGQYHAANSASIADIQAESVKRIEQELLPLMIRDTAAGFPGNSTDFAAFYENWMRAVIDDKRSTRRSDLVFVGRGWVKAGYDFGEFNESNFRYDEANKRIYLKNLRPTILNVDINPWFIPERQVPGFELIRATGKARNPEDVLRTKVYCKEKLRAQAMERKILEAAQTNAKESLKHFFSLVLNTDIEEVIFTSEYYAYYLQETVGDSLIDRAEAHFLDSLIGLRWHQLPTYKGDELEVQYQSLYSFVEQLEAMQMSINGPLMVNGQPFNYTKYSGMALTVSADGRLDSLEFEQLLQLGASECPELVHAVDSAYQADSASYVDKLWFPTMTAQAGAFARSMSLVDLECDTVLGKARRAVPNVLVILQDSMQNRNARKQR